MLFGFNPDRSIKNKLLIYFIPVIIMTALLTGIFSYILAARQLEENAYYMLNDTIYQTNIFLNDKFTTMFEQLYSIENSQELQNIFLDEYENQSNGYNYTDFLKVNGMFNDVYQKYFQMVDSIYFFSSNGTEIKLYSESVPIKIGVNLKQWFESYRWSDKGYIWINNHVDQVFDTVDKRNVITISKKIGNEASKVKGLLLINLKSNYFLDIMQNVKISSNGYLVLADQDNILSTGSPDTKNALGATGIDYLRRHSGHSGSFNINKSEGTRLIVVYKTLKINNWVLVGVVPEKDILNSTDYIKYISIAIIIFMIMVSSVVSAVFAGSISKPLRYLAGQVKRFEKGDFGVRFDIRDKNEVGVLGNALSTLVNTVQNLLHKVREEQEKKRSVELMALQTQINPHFLYNTLGSIKYLIDMSENGRASKMASALIRFYMIGISRGKEIITVEEEIEHVMNYLYIQNMRYRKNFEFNINISNEILHCKIIKLTLQPIVENAIYHGIRMKEGSGNIKLSGWKEKDKAIIEVFDDGIGIRKEELKRLTESINMPEVEDKPITFGLRNVNQRLVLHFGEEYGLKIESEENLYARVCVIIPFDEQPEAGNNV